MTSNLANVRISFGTLLKINVIGGIGAGLIVGLFFRAVPLVVKGEITDALLAVLLSPIGGVVSAFSLTLFGYPIYQLVMDKRKGHSIELERYENSEQSGL